MWTLQGAPFMYANYSNGELNGTATIYGDKGHPSCVCVYDRGKLISVTNYDEEGVIQSFASGSYLVEASVHSLSSPDMMSKEAFLALASSEYEALCAAGQESDMYALEAKFDALWTALGRSVLEQTVGEVPRDHRKKTLSGPATGRLK